MVTGSDVVIERFNGAHWKDHIGEHIRSTVERFGELVRSRIVPVFDGIDKEASDLQKRRYKELISNVDVEHVNIWDAGEAIADLAYWEASDYHEMLWSMKSATLNLFAAGLYHLTEQQLVDLPNAMLRFHQLKEVRWKREPDDAIAWFRNELGLDLATLPSWPVLNELRHVANVVKHGEGSSERQLRQLQPHLFVDPHLRNQERDALPTRVQTPLFGQTFFVVSDDFVRYHQGSISFWTEVAEQLPKLTR